jgi:calcineurin-like phosphoesterase family protein
LKTFFISDTHFSHDKVIDFCDRPFQSVEEMDEGLIEIWNQTVGKKDTVHHLGDFCFGNSQRWVEILKRLNGKIILYKGNHDYSKDIKEAQKENLLHEVHTVGDYFKTHKQQLWLTHYPMEIGMRPRKWSIHGHIHRTPSKMINQINVGVDSQLDLVQNKPFGEPIELEELLNYLNTIIPKVEEMFHKERLT